MVRAGKSAVGESDVVKALGSRTTTLHPELKRHRAWWREILSKNVLRTLAERVSSSPAAEKVCTGVRRREQQREKYCTRKTGMYLGRLHMRPNYIHLVRPAITTLEVLLVVSSLCTKQKGGTVSRPVYRIVTVYRVLQRLEPCSFMW